MSAQLARSQRIDPLGAPRAYQADFPIDTNSPAFQLLERRIERSLEQLVARWQPPRLLAEDQPARSLEVRHGR